MFNLKQLVTPRSQQIAALDLGSNSFHLIIARWEDGQIHIVDRIKESVRLGWGLSDDGDLDEDAYLRAMDCFTRFGERLRSLSPGNVRVVGTKTLRMINGSERFLVDAQQRLGHPVEIISGEEEARIIYLGVAHDLAPGENNRIVMDIGGGSTEVILGQGMEPLLKESTSMGCVAMTQRFFGDGKVTPAQIKAARIACLQELAPIREAFIDLGWEQEIGASGTIKAVSKVCREQGWSDGEITLESLQKIQQLYIDEGKAEMSLPGLSSSREPVFIGGVMVLSALFEGLGLKSMIAAEWALREGLMYDLKGRLERVDIRDMSVKNLANRFHVNWDLAYRVETTAQQLLEPVATEWEMDLQQASQLLGWSAQLFLVGLDICHTDYHKHGAYITEHVDLPGFSRSEQRDLAALVLVHRKRFPQKSFPMEQEQLVRLALILRLAVILQHGRRGQALPPLKLKAKKSQLKLYLPAEWQDNNQQAMADLETEIRYQKALDYELLLRNLE
jgi:exopolyphosphatase/guanosine-5'-triphosphate,3'-diphosphate pyrophosphatase